MSGAADPHCPECGEPIGQTATYCMHCSADLTEERAAADADGDGAWDEQNTANDADGSGDGSGGRIAAALGVSSSPTEDGYLLADDGLVDDTLTVLVGIAGGTVVGVVGTVVLLALTGSGWSVAFGLVVWLAAVAYLVRSRTVQGAVSKTGYAVAVVLLAVPVIALGPVVEVDGGLGERGSLLVVLLFFVAVPAGIAASIGWIASRFVPEGADEGADAGG